jgi:hypothetical protein
MQITDEEYSNLKANSIMLGQIASYVEDFCKEEDTTLVGVMKLLSEYYYLKSDAINQDIERIKTRS